MIRKLLDVVSLDFFTYDPVTGALCDADSLPSCDIYGSDGSPIVSPVPSKRSTGNYKIDFTISESFSIGNTYQVAISATVGGITAKCVIESFIVDSKRFDDITNMFATDILSDGVKISGQHVANIPENPVLSDDTRIDFTVDVGAIADAIQDEQRGDHTIADTFGKYLDAQISSVAMGDVTIDTASIADAVQNEATADHTAAGSFGANLDEKVSTRASQGSVNSIPTNTLLTDDIRLDALDTSISSRLASDDTRLDYIDASVSSRASQGSVDLIPTDTLLSDDIRLDYLDASVSTRATQVSVNNIPTNPLLTSDTRLNALDTSVSSRLASDDTRLDYLDASVSSRASQGSVDLIPTNPLLTNDLRLDALDDSISSIDFTVDVGSIADAIQDEQRGDHTQADTFGKYLDSEISSIAMGDVTIDTASIADAIWNEAAADHTTAGSFGANLDGSVSSRASQNSVNSIPTNPLLTNDLRINALDTSVSSRLASDDTRLDYIDASVSSRASQGSVDLIPTDTLLSDDTRLDYLDASVSTRASQISVNAIPINPLLTNDLRLNALDNSISSRLASDDTRLNYLDASISQIIMGDVTMTIDADAIANAVWNDTRSDHTAVGSFGEAIDAKISSRSSQGSVDLIPTNTLLSDDTRLDYLDASVSTRATQISVNAIPVSTLLSNDARLNSLDDSISSRASQGSLDLIPINPLLSDDTRLNILASISTLATQSSVNAIPTNPLRVDDTRLNYLDASISSIVMGDVTISDLTIDTASIADAVWNERIADHTLAGTFGAKNQNLVPSEDISDYWGSGGDLTVDFTALEDKIDQILIDTSQIQSMWDTTSNLYEMLQSAANAGSGTGSRLVKFTMWVTDNTETIQGVRISIFSNYTHVAQGVSDINGQFSALLDDGTYQVMCYKFGYTFDVITDITVSQSGSMDIYATAIAIESPDPSAVCRVYEWCYTVDSEPLPAVTATARIVALPYDSTGKLISGDEVAGIYDPNSGLVYWDFVHGARVQFNIVETMVGMTRRVPASASARLSEIPRL